MSRSRVNSDGKTMVVVFPCEYKGPRMMVGQLDLVYLDFRSVKHHLSGSLAARVKLTGEAGEGRPRRPKSA